MRQPIVILHGWGTAMSGGRYFKLKELLESSGFNVYAPDLPGFGKNILTKEQLTFDDYIDFVLRFVNEVIKENNSKKIILIGHSFGGRIAIAFASRYSHLIDKLILTGASGINRPLPSLKKRVIFMITKVLRPLFFIPPMSLIYRFLRKLVYYSIGELDYYKAGKLSKTFKNVYRVNIIEDLPKINVSTLIVWGQDDTITPPSDGKLMHKHIRNSKLLILRGEGHRLPYVAPEKFYDTILPFLEKL